MYKEFGDAFRHPPRTAKSTLEQLASITCDPLNVEGYFNECSLFRLSGVFLPFWRNWPLADPSWFLTPKALHHWHREFYDHNVKWCLRAIGAQELDFHFSALQQLTMFRHFKDGISNLKQVTGRAQRDMQCYMVALIADAAPPGFIIAVRALMDFRYLSQATMIDELHCRLILDALKQFHDHKHEVIACGACRGMKSNSILDNWYIPKLELMQSVVPSVHQVGSLVQWSVDTTEHAHITLIKDPADSTNHNNYDVQICQFLDQNEKCRNFRITTSIITQSRSHQQDAASSTIDVDSDIRDPGVDEADPQTAADDLWEPRHTVTDFFKMAQQVSSDIKAAKPPHTFLVGTSTAIHLILTLPYNAYRLTLSLKNSLCPTCGEYLLTTLNKRVAQGLVQMNVSPPSATGKYGHYDTAIFTVDDTKLNQWPASGLKGHTVVEVHLVMQPLPPQGKTTLGLHTS
ncbi:hypothetical protein F4604DRAFT_1682293 [Suillus subluteus]|nr:hypothetical protein F4604DRAFT_1682293 [Suillus subluteus]